MRPVSSRDGSRQRGEFGLDFRERPRARGRGARSTHRPFPARLRFDLGALLTRQLARRRVGRADAACQGLGAAWSSGTTASTRCTSRSASGLWPGVEFLLRALQQQVDRPARARPAPRRARAARAARPGTGRARCGPRAPRGGRRAALPGLATGPDRRAPLAAVAGAGVTGAAATAVASGASGSPPTKSGTTSASVTRPINAR